LPPSSAGYDEGRLLFASCASASGAGGAPPAVDGYGLTPLLASWAADLLSGAAPSEEAARAALSREALAAKAAPPVVDTWGELGRYLEGGAGGPRAGSAEAAAAEEAAEEAAETRRDREREDAASEKYTKMYGGSGL
jgi:hypothetical protein